jgi:Tol biopolymer transport system component
MNPILRVGVLSIAALGASAVQAANFSLVSLRSDGQPPVLFSPTLDQPAITPNSRYVVFVGTADDLVSPPATGGGRQVFLRDRVAGTTELISVGPTGSSANNSVSYASISDDGCRVYFLSFADNLVPGKTGFGQEAYVRNRCTQPATTELVSISTGGARADAPSYEGRISGDGKKAVFISGAKNLVPNPLDAGGACLFVRDFEARTTTAVVAPNGRCVQGAAPDPGFDASRIAFWAQYKPGEPNRYSDGVWQILMHELSSGAFVVASSDANGVPQTQGNEGSSTVTEPALSPDGGYVAFRSRGNGLVAQPGGGFSHVYVKELATGAIVRTSVDSAGNAGNGDSSGSGQGYRPGLSRNAETVTFLTNATNLAPETGGVYPNVVAHNPYTGRTVGFSAQKYIEGLPAITAGGELIVAYSSFGLDPAFPSSRGMFAFAGMNGRLGNISTRGRVQTGNDVMIGGFVIGGSLAKKVLITARGPSLGSFGIANPLANPKIEIFSGQTKIFENDNWQAQGVAEGGNAAVAEIAATGIFPTGLAPSNANEAALMLTLSPGAYTAVVSGADGGSGVGIVEVFEQSLPEVPLANISTRGQVQTGNDVMIGGFVVQGDSPRQVLITARGPSLADFGITNPLANPKLEIYAGQTKIFENDDWQTQSDAAGGSGSVQAIQALGIFPSGLAPSNTNEAALLITLNPGAYTAVVSGVNGGTGVGIVEVFAR